MGRRASALGGLLLLTGCGSEVHTTVGGDVAGLRTGLLQVEPAEIHLGHVAPGEEPVVELVLRNPGTQVVDVTDLGLAGDALGFSLPEPPSLPLEVEPGDEIRVPVRFRAWDGRTVVARLELRSDASNAPWIVVPLSAQGDTRRLRVEPVPLDLGEVQVGCDAVGLLELVGAGSSAVRVDAVRGELPEGLSLTSALSLPRDLAQDQRAAVSVILSPRAEGALEGRVVVESDDTAGTWRVPVTAVATPRRRLVERFEVRDTFEADVFLAVDRSRSMVDDGPALGEALGSLIAQLDAVGGRWRVGVVHGTEDHCFVGGWLDAGTPDWREELAERVAGVPDAYARTLVGTNDLTEALLEASVLAAEQDVFAGCNAGFRRPGAALHVVVVSDERDQSSGFATRPHSYWKDWVGGLTTYAGVAHLLRIHGVVNAFGRCTPNHGARGYVEAVEATGGVLADVCDPPADVIPALREGFGVRPRTFRVAREDVVVPSLEVRLDGERLATGWSWDAEARAVVLDTPVSLAVEVVEVSFAVEEDCRR